MRTLRSNLLPGPCNRIGQLQFAGKLDYHVSRTSSSINVKPRVGFVFISLQLSILQPSWRRVCGGGQRFRFVAKFWHQIALSSQAYSSNSLPNRRRISFNDPSVRKNSYSMTLPCCSRSVCIGATYEQAEPCGPDCPLPLNR